MKKKTKVRISKYVSIDFFSADWIHIKEEDECGIQVVALSRKEANKIARKIEKWTS